MIADAWAPLVNELVRLKVDVIVATGPYTSRAAKAATETIPIVAMVLDPVETGLVLSLARPGGNLTGLTIIGTDFTAKQLQLLKELVPRAKRMAIVSSWDNGRKEQDRRESQTAADRLGVQAQFFEARTVEDIDGILAAATAKNIRVDAMHVYGTGFLYYHRQRIIAQAKARRLPAIYYYPAIVREGGLMAFGPDEIEQFRRLAGVVDKILKGARSADIPVEDPTKYVFAINLKTARELGLKVPQSLLVRADQVIE